MSTDYEDIQRNKEKEVWLPIVSQHEGNAIAFAIGETLKTIDRRPDAARFGFTRQTYVGILRKFGYTGDFSPPSMKKHENRTKLASVLRTTCNRCYHARLAHGISSSAKQKDPYMELVSSFLEESSETKCLMPGCHCRSFRS